MEAIGELTARIAAAGREVEALCEAHPETAALRRVTGVGPITALTFVLPAASVRRWPRGSGLTKAATPRRGWGRSPTDYDFVCLLVSATRARNPHLRLGALPHSPGGRGRARTTSMAQYIVKRLLLAIPTIFIVSTIVFGLLRLIPGDIALQRLSQAGYVTDELLEKQRAELGIDRPVLEQYADWVSHAIRGDLGNSLWSDDPVLDLIITRLPLSLEIVVLSMLIAVLIAIPLGVFSAVNQDKPADYSARLFSIFGLSVPDFVLGTLTILVLSALLDDITFGLMESWLPPLGWYPPWTQPWTNFQALIFPVLILAYRASAVNARMVRSTMLEVMRQDYVRTARAKGLSERTVIMRHALRNSIIPVLTIMGAQLANIFGGTVIIEQIFALPGLGRLTLDAVTQRDYTVVQGTVLLMACMYVLVNLVIDLSYGLIDPRIRYA